MDTELFQQDVDSSLGKRAAKFYENDFIDFLVDLYDPDDLTKTAHWSTYNQDDMMDKHTNSFYPCCGDIFSAECLLCERAFCPFGE